MDKKKPKKVGKSKEQIAKEAMKKLYYDEALGYLKGANYPQAVSLFNMALELSPNDKNALVARSRCHLLLGEPQLSLQDAEAALAIDKTLIKALFQKAEALYHLGAFEYSLMYFHRGLRVRPEMEGFRLGVQKSQEAIENVIGNDKSPFPSSPSLLKSLLGNLQILDEPPPQRPPSNVPKAQPPTIPKKINPKSEKVLLGELYEDKKYLEKLLNRPDIISLNQNFANNDVAAHALEGIEFLNARQEFWRQRKPNSTKSRKTFKSKERSRK